MLGKSRWVEHDKIILLFAGFHKSEHILGIGRVLIFQACEGRVALGQLDGALGAVHGVHQRGTSLQSVHRKAPRVAKRIQNTATSRVAGQQVAIVALVDEEASFLTRFPIYSEGMGVFVYQMLRAGRAT